MGFCFAHCGIASSYTGVDNRNTLNDEQRKDVLEELYGLIREYEAALLVTSETEEKWRLRRMLEQLRQHVIEVENS